MPSSIFSQIFDDHPLVLDLLQLHAIHRDLHPSELERLHVSTFDPDRAYRYQAFAALTSVWSSDART